MGRRLLFTFFKSPILDGFPFHSVFGKGGPTSSYRGKDTSCWCWAQHMVVSQQTRDCKAKAMFNSDYSYFNN